MTSLLDTNELALLARLQHPPTARRVTRPPHGQDNSVAIVDDRWVVRIARTDDARRSHANEVAVLRALPADAPVPRPLAFARFGIVYEQLPGEPLDRAAWNALDHSSHGPVAAQLVAALHALHRLPHATAPDPLDVLDEAWVRRSIRACSAMEPRARLGFDPDALLERFEEAWSLEHAPTSIVHVDLKPANLVVEGDRIGVLDFGGLALGDPAIDYGVLSHHLGEELLVAMGIGETPLAARARCFADLYHLRRCTRGWTRSAGWVAER